MQSISDKFKNTLSFLTVRGSMKRIFLAIITLILILLAGYITLSYEPYTLKTFIIQDNQENTETSYTNLNTYTIPQEQSGRFQLIQTIKQTKCARQRNILYQHREEEIEKCMKKITKNWKRTYYKKSYEKVYDDNKEEWITTNLFYEREREFYGYDEDEDWRLYWKLRNRALNGEKIC